MDKKNILTKVLAVIGTGLVWIPLLAPILFGLVSLTVDHIFRFDYLMPAELGLLAFGGGILLLWAALRVRLRLGIIAWGLGIAVAAMVVLNVFGDVEPGSWQWATAIGLLSTYSLAIAVVCVGGVLLLRDLFKPPQVSSKNL